MCIVLACGQIGLEARYLWNMYALLKCILCMKVCDLWRSSLCLLARIVKHTWWASAEGLPSGFFGLFRSVPVLLFRELIEREAWVWLITSGVVERISFGGLSFFWGVKVLFFGFEFLWIVGFGYKRDKVIIFVSCFHQVVTMYISYKSSVNTPRL